MTLFYADPLATLFKGDARKILAEMDPGSVDMAMTSPPYWGLRSYDGEPLVWGGEPDCAHEWGSTLKTGDLRFRGETTNTGTNKNRKVYDASKGLSNFCLKCGAWRGQLGSEPTPDLYIKHLCDIFDQVKRVLKPTGTLWVNLDDSASGSGQGGGGGSIQDDRAGIGIQRREAAAGVPAKSLVGIPERFVLEMMRRGWVRRRTIIWHKPNVMPESCADAFTIDFEYLYFFSRSDRMLFWVNEKTRAIVNKHPPGPQGEEGIDWDWIECSRCSKPAHVPNTAERNKEPYTGNNPHLMRLKPVSGVKSDCPRCKGTGKVKRSYWHGKTYFFDQQFEPQTGNAHSRGTENGNLQYQQERGSYIGFNTPQVDLPLGRHMRSVWTIPTKGYKGAHFAVYPEELCRTPILAGCPAAVCQKCGLPKVKIYSKGFTDHGGTSATKFTEIGGHNANRLALLRQSAREHGEEYQNTAEVAGYSECGCGAGYRPGVVLDPFAGTSATLAMAKRLGRRSIGIETAEKYCQLSVGRIEAAPAPLEAT